MEDDSTYSLFVQLKRHLDLALTKQRFTLEEYEHNKVHMVVVHYHCDLIAVIAQSVNPNDSAYCFVMRALHRGLSANYEFAGTVAKLAFLLEIYQTTCGSWDVVEEVDCTLSQVERCLR